MKRNGVQGKAEKVRAELLMGIQNGEYPLGSKLPTVSQLAKMFKISPTTAFTVVRQLANEGLVDCRTGPRGTIVLRQESGMSSFARTTLACLLRPHDSRTSWSPVDNFGLNILLGLRNEISDRGYRFVHHSIDETDHEKRMIELIETGAVSGVIVDQLADTGVARRIAAAGLPSVMFNRTVDMENMSVIVPDYARIGRETVKFLLKKGYERVAFYPLPQGELKTQGRFLPAYEIYEGFMEAVRSEGLSSEQAFGIPRVEPNDPAKNRVEEFGLPSSADGNWHKLGVLAPFDTRALQLAGALSRSELKIGRDIGFVGSGDLECNTSLARPFSTWRIDCEDMGRETVRELLRRIESPSRPRSIIKLPVEFVDRGSA